MRSTNCGPSCAGNRLTTVTGQAGVGKTRLVEALVSEPSVVDAAFAAVTFVPLAEVARPELVLPAISARLGITEGGSRSPLNRIVEALGDRDHLLVLDNFEHLPAAMSVPADLVARCPQLRIVVTSRVPLRHRSEHVDVAASPRPPGSTDPAELANEPAVGDVLGHR